ncbi:MAG: hypothetical protein J0I98_22785 [Mesorhizobium sp.]|nr:hypothetical protein [Mesorhizobium sp.]MBN9245608.1 hypothetical protein [Mesorhizobium sp.]MBN9272259.1 hypothetical protein [Mesorhizobium sp.]
MLRPDEDCPAPALAAAVVEEKALFAVYAAAAGLKRFHLLKCGYAKQNPSLNPAAQVSRPVDIAVRKEKSCIVR